MEEIWRDIPGYEGRYQISIATKEGKCRSLNWEGRSGWVKELTNKSKTLKGEIKRIFWGLTKDGKRTFYQAARWIAITYPELVQNEYFEGAVIDHINTDSMDNRPENLRWVTRKGNQNNPLTKEHISKGKKGKKNPKSWKPVLQFNIFNRLIARYDSLQIAAEETGINKSIISECCNKKRDYGGDYIWKYEREVA